MTYTTTAEVEDLPRTVAVTLRSLTDSGAGTTRSLTLTWDEFTALRDYFVDGESK